MFQLIRIDKRIPGGSIWQARRSYLLPDHDGWTRAYSPAGTEWSNPLGGWKQMTPGVSLFRADRQFTISCHGAEADKRFYIDIAHRVRIGDATIEFTDLFLDVMIDAQQIVTEKDEHQLAALTPALQHLARASRDDVRRRIESGDPLFDAASAYYAVPPDARALPASVGSLGI